MMQRWQQLMIIRDFVDRAYYPVIKSLLLDEKGFVLVPDSLKKPLAQIWVDEICKDFKVSSAFVEERDIIPLPYLNAYLSASMMPAKSFVSTEKRGMAWPYSKCFWAYKAKRFKEIFRRKVRKLRENPRRFFRDI